MIVKDEITQHIALLTYKKVTDSETRTITFLDSMNLSASSFYCRTVKIARKSGIMMDIAIFLLNNTASYSKESSVDKLYVSIFAICNSETQFHSLLSRYFPDLSKKYFSTRFPQFVRAPSGVCRHQAAHSMDKKKNKWKGK